MIPRDTPSHLMDNSGEVQALMFAVGCGVDADSVRAHASRARDRSARKVLRRPRGDGELRVHVALGLNALEGELAGLEREVDRGRAS